MSRRLATFAVQRLSLLPPSVLLLLRPTTLHRKRENLKKPKLFKMGNLLSQDANEPTLTKASAESKQAYIQAKIENAVTRAKIEADNKVNFETITSKNVLFLQKNLDSILNLCTFSILILLTFFKLTTQKRTLSRKEFLIINIPDSHEIWINIHGCQPNPTNGHI